MRICPLHEIVIFPDSFADYRAYVFYKKNGDIEKCAQDGTTDKLMMCVREELVRAGGGKVAEPTVIFEIDSDENVSRKFNGNYWKRLH